MWRHEELPFFSRQFMFTGNSCEIAISAKPRRWIPCKSR
jgi:hypothetical protein